MARKLKPYKELTPEQETELEARILAEKTPRQQVEIKAHWALVALSKFYEKEGSRLFYRVNKLIHELWKLSSTQL